MIKVCIRSFDSKNRQFKNLGPAEFQILPKRDDKICMDIKDVGYIFKIYDIHFSDKSGIDVLVIPISTKLEYDNSKFHDIELKWNN